MTAKDIVVEFANGTGLGSTPTWTNVSSKVKHVTTTRGRQYDEDTFQPGTLEIVLDDSAGDFDPSNSSGAYYGALAVNYAWRVSYPGTFIGYGYADTFSRTWPGGMAYSETTVRCTDRFKVLNKNTFGPLTRSATAPGEGTDVRIDAILDALGVGATSSSRLINAGGWVARNVEATTYPVKTNGLTALQDINKAEGGVLYVNGAGVIVYDLAAARSNETRSNTSQATYQFGLANVGGAFDVTNDLNPLFDDQLYANFVRVTDSAGTEHTWPASYPADPVEFDLGATLLNGVDAGFRARDLYTRRFKVVSRVEKATLDCADTSSYRVEALAREISDRVTCVIEPRAGGATFTQDYFIESVQHVIDVDNDDWKCGFGLNPVPIDLGGPDVLFTDEISADHPALYWRCGDTSGTTLTDSSGNGRDGTLVGSYALGTAGLGDDTDKAVTFSGGYAHWTPPSGDNLSGSYTVCMLIKGSNLASNPKTVGTRDQTAGGEYSFEWQLSQTGGNAVIGDGAGWYTIGAGGSWSMVNGTIYLIHYRVDAVAKTWEWFLNGTSVASGSYTGTNPPKLWDDTNHALFLGWNGRAGETTYQGVIDEFAVFAAALSNARIHAHAAAL